MFIHYWRHFTVLSNQVLGSKKFYISGKDLIIRSLSRVATQILIIVLILGSMGVKHVFATGILVVTKTADTNDGVCDLDCSLREAIAVAASGDTIIFDASLSGQTIHLTSTLTLSKNVTIDSSALASQITISGDSNNDGTGDIRVFHISYVTVTINAMNIVFGLTTGYYGGGGIWNEGGTLTVINSTFSQNIAYGGGGAINNNGIYNASILTVINSTFSNNSGGDGGGISNYGGVLNVKNSTFSNDSANKGGAILSSGSIVLTNNTFSGNYANYGGAIWAYSLTMTNNTFSGNITISSSGGGSVATYGTGNTIIFANNIIGNSTGTDCYYEGTFITNINNLVEDGSCLASLSGNPRLGGLKNNGGLTQTMALVSGSPAINAGDDTTCAASPVNNLDQRSITRPIGAHCDIGAYEGSIPTTKNTYNPTASQDGWILESSETSNKGGTLNSTATLLYVGDNAQDKQYKSILSFNTTSLPDNAVITKVQVKVNVQGFVGGNMFTPTKTLGNLLMDINKPYFGASAGLVTSDFQAAASRNNIGVVSSIPGTGWRTIILKNTAYPYINLTGTTQLRFRFQKDDNDDLGNDYLKIFSGNASAASSPQLIVEYYVP